jgi:hypothetical protein
MKNRKIGRKLKKSAESTKIGRKYKKSAKGPKIGRKTENWPKNLKSVLSAIEASAILCLWL